VKHTEEPERWLGYSLNFRQDNGTDEDYDSRGEQVSHDEVRRRWSMAPPPRHYCHNNTRTKHSTNRAYGFPKLTGIILTDGNRSSARQVAAISAAIWPIWADYRHPIPKTIPIMVSLPVFGHHVV